jgi:tetratricopeptide (TPR) repeat protein
MSTSSLVRLDEYRIRRQQRLREATALYGADPERSTVASILEKVLLLVDGDRASAVWVDEYGPGVVHVHCVLDLLHTPPRRGFDPAHLQAAWEEGVPGFRDWADLSASPVVPILEGVRSTAAVAMGSDGSRSWYVVVDSVRPRAALPASQVSQLMFLAGECASILLHRDLPFGGNRLARPSSFERRRSESFGAWPVLQDIEGREGDEEANRRIAARFLVARLVRGLIEEEFAVELESVLYRASGVRREVDTIPAGDPERILWESVVDAVEVERPAELARVLLELGNLVERSGHLFGAREFHRTAYDVAVIAGDSASTVEAARFHARTCRRLGDLVESERWYSTALEISRARGEARTVSVVLDGLANTFREMGQTARARAVVVEGMEVARGMDDRYALASGHHTMLALDKDDKNWSDAIVNGWAAFGLYPETYHQTLALLDLAGVFVETGQYRSAEDAYLVVRDLAPNQPAAIMASVSLVQVAATQGDIAAFEARWDELHTKDWDVLAPAYRTQVMIVLGRSFAELGRTSEARSWLERARSLAEVHAFTQLGEDALFYLEGLGGPGVKSVDSPVLGERAGRVLLELRQLREDVARAS